MQNAVKHSGASRISVELREDDKTLSFVVSDDGVGFDRSEIDATGITNMTDRLAAVAGRVEISSSPGKGTVVTGWVPIP
jgi:signal transduction histidine kinase